MHMAATVGVLQTACTPSPEWVKAQRQKIGTNLVSTDAGYEWLGFASGEWGVQITDYDGVISKRTWPSEKLTGVQKAQLKSCVDNDSGKLHRIGTPARQEEPRLLRESAVKCVADLGLQAPFETKGQSSKGFDLALRVASDPLPQGDGVPLFWNGGRMLGANLHLDRSPVDYKSAESDMDRCLTEAASRGLLQTWKSDPSENSGSGMSYQSQSIRPLINRFSDCMKNAGYTVTDATIQR